MNDVRCRPLIYVAGPYGASKTEELRQSNVTEADRCARALALWGAAPIVPHKNTFGWQDEIPKEVIFGVDFTLLAQCRALVWVLEVTTGVAAEIAVADAMGIPVFCWDPDTESINNLALEEFIQEAREADTRYDDTRYDDTGGCQCQR